MDEKKPPAGKRPTIVDVAKRAGVAQALVSRALSTERRPISQDKKERVLKAAAELGYTQNPLARGLLKKSLDLIAIIVNSLNDLSDLDLFDPLLEAIQAVGKQATIIRVGNTKGIERFLRNSIAYHVDSAIVFSDFTDSQGARALFDTENVLMLNGRTDAFSSAIQINDETGIAEAVGAAKAKGAATVALVTGRASSLHEQARCEKFRRSFDDHGLRLLFSVQGDYSYASGQKAAEALDLQALPGAVFCTSDAMAMGVMDTLRRAGKSPPHDVLLYGFDVVRRANFDPYDISSIGFRKAELIAMIASFVADPVQFAKEGSVRRIDTRFVPRSTG